MVAHHAATDREALHESVGPWTIDGLVSDVHRHAAADHWLWATTSICFLQELLFCIEDGGVELSRHLGDGFADEIEALRDLRNVVAHPTNMPAPAWTDVDFAAKRCSRQASMEPSTNVDGDQRRHDDGPRAHWLQWSRRRTSTAPRRLVKSEAQKIETSMEPSTNVDGDMPSDYERRT